MEKLKKSPLLLALLINGLILLPQTSFAVAPSFVPAASSSMDFVKVGIVAAVNGRVEVLKPGQIGRAVESGEPIYLGDEISTGSEGRLQILLMDETVFTIGPNSAIVIDTFVYDPLTHEGELKAKVVKGVFRFLTGKIAKKKPTQMEVELPSGTIGIRGTIVAGEVNGKESLVMLMGPGDRNNTAARDGKFILRNKVTEGGKEKIKKIEVDRSGFGSKITGDGAPPTKAFKVPVLDMKRITKALGASVPPPGKPLPKATEKTQSKKGEKTATERSGQAKAAALGSVKDGGKAKKLFKKLSTETSKISQTKIAALTSTFPDGQTTRAQLNTAAQSLSGKFHYKATNIDFSVPSLSVATVKATFQVDIDFSNKTVGGGNSKITGGVSGLSSCCTGSFQFDLASKNFSDAAANGVFTFNSINNSLSPCNPMDCVGNATVSFNNSGGEAAKTANLAFTIAEAGLPSNVYGSGSATGTRSSGAST